MQPASLNLPFQRGTFGSPAAVNLQFLDANNAPSQLPGASFVLCSSFLGFSILKQTSDGSMSFDEDASTLTWVPTEAEVDSIPIGATVPYTLDVHFFDGSSMRLAEGFLVGRP